MCVRVSVCMCVVLFCVYSVDRESEIGDRKLESWTLRNVEDCCFSCYFNDLTDFSIVRFSAKCLCSIKGFVCVLIRF